MLRMVERDMMRGKKSRYQVKQVEEKREWNRRQEETLQKESF